jgi:transcriptional regulator
VYLPPKFEERDLNCLQQVIDENPFASLISVFEGKPEISHLPLILESNGSKMRLIGHMAKANPQWRHLEGSPVTIAFQGPQTYITPKWYVENDVPTWNYVVVHVMGPVRLMQTYEELVQALRLLTQKMEQNASDPWEFWLPEDLESPQVLQNAIVGFEIEVQEIKGKFKLSQNRSEQDRSQVIEGLGARVDEMSRGIQALMIRNQQGSAK